MISEKQYNNNKVKRTIVAARAIMPGVVFVRPQSATFDGRFPMGSPSIDDFPCKTILRNCEALIVSNTVGEMNSRTYIYKRIRLKHLETITTIAWEEHRCQYGILLMGLLWVLE